MILSFDGSRSLATWAATRDLARTLTRQGAPVRFTYFVSAVYFLTDAEAGRYRAPRQRPGQSAIGFGGTVETVAARRQQVCAALREGHEIASHAGGHYDGSSWTEAEWTAELDAFDAILSGTFRACGLPRSPVVGVRAPHLGTGDGYYYALLRRGLRYDASRIAAPSAWPDRWQGVWLYPLALLPLPGGRKTLSMDYNLYLAHSGGKEDPRKALRAESEALDLFLRYFEASYRGNRAPVHLGHHFSAYLGGAYHRALGRFAARVCGRPEVRCVTYRELTGFLDAQPAARLQAWRDAAKVAPGPRR